MKKSLIVSIIMLFSLPAAAEDNPADAVKACIGVARVLEMFAVDRRDADAADKYRNAKVYFIQKSGLTEPEVIKIIMATMKVAADTREMDGISTDELRSQFESVYTDQCGKF